MPIDRATIELVWSRGGYPADAAYRNYHHFTEHRHRAWANDGTPYDPARAAAAARRHAADFVTRTRGRVAGGGLAVCAVDTELLGDWWHEGPLWLAAVVEEAAAQGLRLSRLDDALARHAPAARRADLPVTSWGTPRDLTTWSAPPVADMAWSARDAELRTVAARRTRRTSAPRASCSRCSPATGRSSSPRSSPSRTAASAPPGIAPRSMPR